MQISAANLLLAGQQTMPRTQGASFSATMAEAKPARFSPPDFANETQDIAPEPAPVRAATPQTGYTATAVPGSQLDIRV